MSWASWQPWAIGSIATVVILWFVYRALFADRPRSGPRCVRCGQPFTPEQGLTCNECGWTARTDKDLLRTRRHWGKAGLGLLLLFSASMFVRIQAQGGNPLSVLPDRLLVWSLPFDVPGPIGRGPVSSEIQRRLVERADEPGAVDGLIALALDAVARGDADSPPGSTRWLDRYGGLAGDLRDGFIGPGTKEATRLARIPPVMEVDVPTEWPSDESVPANLRIRDFWVLGTEAVIDLRWKGDPDAPPLESIGFRNLASIRRRHHFLLPPTASWPTPATLEFSTRTRSMPESSRAQVEAGMAARSLESSATITPFIPAPRVEDEIDRPKAIELELQAWPGDADTDAAIASVFRDGLRRWPDAARPYAIRFDLRGLEDERYAGVLFGLVIEIVERTADDEESIRRRTRIWLAGGRDLVGSRGARRGSGWTISEEDIGGLAGAFDPTSDSEWLLRIRGDESLARRALALGPTDVDETPSDRWWSGRVERSLPTKTIGTGRPFIRMWFDPDGVKPPTVEPASEWEPRSSWRIERRRFGGDLLDLLLDRVRTEGDERSDHDHRRDPRGQGLG